MSKEILKAACKSAVSDYSWTLYFINVDRRSEQPFKAYKVHFKNTDYLSSYAESLLSATYTYQIDPLGSVQAYDGENSKVSCDKLQTTDALIADEWKHFSDAILGASDRKLEGRINAYILDGQPLTDEKKAISFVKVSNPATKLKNKKSVVFKATAEDELDLIADDVYRLYLTTDFIVYDNAIYTFNHTFEALFNMEKTMAKVKNAAIDTILDTNVFADVKQFKSLAQRYKSARTFITLKQERLNRIKDTKNRIKIAEMLKIPRDDSENLIITTEEQASLIIRYLCFKILQDEETKDVFEASGINKLNI